MIVSGVVALEFTETINIVSFFLVAAALISVIYGARYKAAFEAAKSTVDVLAENADAEKQRADRYEERLAETVSELTDAKELIARYESMPDLAALRAWLDEDRRLQAEAADVRMASGLDKIGERFAWHEEHAQERHESQIAVLAGIAASLERVLQVAERDER